MPKARKNILVIMRELPPTSEHTPSQKAVPFHLPRELKYTSLKPAEIHSHMLCDGCLKRRRL
jgi:hypothetical protein